MITALVTTVLLAAADEPARRLPRVTTVCRGAGTRGCWAEPGESGCAGGDVFRIVIDEPGRSDVARALGECRRPSQAAPSQ